MDDDEKEMKTDLWKNAAKPQMMQFMKDTRYFIGEDMKAYVEERIGPCPNPAVFGRLFRDYISSNKFAVVVGVQKSQNKKNKGHSFRRYRSLLVAAETSLTTPLFDLLELRRKINMREITIDDALKAAYALGAGNY